MQDRSHLVALSAVSRKFRSLVFSRIFEVLTIRQRDEHDLWGSESYPYIRKASIARVRNVLATVRELVFRASFDNTEPERLDNCFHFHSKRKRALIADGPRSEDSEFGDYGLMKWAKKIGQLLSALPDNHLSSFRYLELPCDADTPLMYKPVGIWERAFLLQS